MKTTPALESEKLSFAFDTSKRILSEISLSVGKGSFVVLAGRNGSGKSVLMRCLKGLAQPTGGIIRLDGEDLTKDPRKRNRLIGLVFQDADTQVVGQTVERDILFGLENLGVTGKERTQRMERIVELLGLGPLLHQRPRTLSGGERRRLAIAGVLVMQPHVLAMDEPFANLDYTGVVQVLESLVELNRKGQTIVVTTHEIEKILAHADSIVLLDSGKVVTQDTADRVLPLVENFGIRRPMHHGKPIPVGELTWLR